MGGSETGKNPTDCGKKGAKSHLLDAQAVSGEQADVSVYHYYPDLEQVRVWFDQAGLVIEEEGTGDGYAHLLARKKA